MNPLAELFDARLPAGLGGRWYGVFPALVTDIKDPDGQGRVKISLPWSPDAQGAACELWARLATLMGGNNRGSWFIPDVNDVCWSPSKAAIRAGPTCSAGCGMEKTRRRNPWTAPATTTRR